LRRFVEGVYVDYSLDNHEMLKGLYSPVVG
jgi:hypothetical protein